VFTVWTRASGAVGSHAVRQRVARAFWTSPSLVNSPLDFFSANRWDASEIALGVTIAPTTYTPAPKVSSGVPSLKRIAS
jgi:hypothetical protein